MDRSQRPVIVQMGATLVPEQLVAQNRWVLWRQQLRRGKPTKVPISVRTGREADVTDPQSWGTHTACVNAIQRTPGAWDGAGIVLGDLRDGNLLMGLDLDQCLDEDGVLADWAKPYLRELPTYAEISPSRTGLKLFFRGRTEDLPAIRAMFAIDNSANGRKRTYGSGDHPPAAEIYLGKRYFTATGDQWPGSADDISILRRDELRRVADLFGPRPAASVGNDKIDDATPPNPEDLEAKLRALISRNPRFASRWSGQTDGLSDATRSGIDMSLGTLLKAAGFSYGEMRAALIKNEQGAGAEHANEGNERYFRRIWERSAVGYSPARGAAPPVLSPAAPLDAAREMIKHRYHAVFGKVLCHQEGDFFRWDETHYRKVQPEEIRADAYQFLEGAMCKQEDTLRPFNPNKSKVANLMEALAAVAQVPGHVRAPAWFDEGDHPPPEEILACRNGLLHLPTRIFLPNTPAFFNKVALPFEYLPRSGPPAAWLEFLEQLWPDDRSSIDTLQEMCGLFLTGDTRHQKAFLVVGPKRSGKGTIARVLTALVGKENVCGPTLNSLAQNFGLSALIGKRLAVISDARLSGKVDQHIIIERLLSITGEDSLTVDRKFLDPWTGRLEVRFMILTNELPRLTDASGAIASRFITLVLRNSFFGSEDHGLTDRLLSELPGILLWSLKGWDRLRQRGYFKPPASAQAVQQELEDLSSPIGAFIRDCCDVGPERSISCDALYQCWGTWCDSQGRDHPGTVQTFGRELRAAVPGLSISNPRSPYSGKQVRHYQGIGPKSSRN